ncbi:trypsin inhibitor ClTI-1-like [Lepisosteus oculatus]|uniref:trypsin inhibitor ClTI-1-like n=1 Tax=Lepisosteus oculatus TaxID=7918 RepID=UPI0035F506B0
MQTTTRLFVFLAAAFCLAGLARGASIPSGGTPPDCGQYMIPACPRNFDPVCGTNGVVYGNECMLCADNMEKNTNFLISKRGEC